MLILFKKLFTECLSLKIINSKANIYQTNPHFPCHTFSFLRRLLTHQLLSTPSSPPVPLKFISPLKMKNILGEWGSTPWLISQIGLVSMPRLLINIICLALQRAEAKAPGFQCFPRMVCTYHRPKHAPSWSIHGWGDRAVVWGVGLRVQADFF